MAYPIEEKLTPEKCRLGEKNEKLWKEIIKNCTIISLEELIAEISPDDFNEAVSRCIKSNNYSAEWGINLSAPSGVSGLSSQEK